MHEGPVLLNSPLHGSEAICVVGAVNVVIGAFIGEVVIGVSEQV